MTRRRKKEKDPFKEWRETDLKPKRKGFFDRFKRENRGWDKPRFTFHGFKRVLALVLVLVYVLAIIVSAFSSPIVGVFMGLTLLILIDYVKQTGKRSD